MYLSGDAVSENKPFQCNNGNGISSIYRITEGEKKERENKEKGDGRW